ncbi:MAG: 1-phosphofructokinase [Candidatus Omnitrophica bacterium]|nr:1-phosphofructokinase [Candidatus Omnitrophota bacterium]
MAARGPAPSLGRAHPVIATITLNPSLDEWMQLSSLRVGRLNRATGFARYPGGKGINVSRVVHELGGHTVAFGLAGGDDGLILRELMNRLALPHRFIPVAGSTRNNYKILTDDPAGLTEINTAGPVVSRRVLAALQRTVLTHRPAPAAVVLSGSLPPGAPVHVYQRWIRLLQARDIPTVLDASGAALRHGLRAHPWCIKPNRDEAAEVLRTRLTTVTQCVHGMQRLLQMGPRIVMLSLGRDGALLGCAHTREVWQAVPPRIRARSAVGAGDSLIGGFLTGWVRGQPLQDAFRLGVASGTATAMTPGTELCHRADVMRMLRRVTIKRVA